MLKKTVTYEDYDGNTRTEDLYFFLSKSELMQLELSEPGGLSKKLERITKTNDGKEIIDVFKDIIRMSYGEKSEDGRVFIKKRNGMPIFEEFEQTPAYDALFTELLLDPDKASAFINGILPKDIMELTKKEMEKNKELPADVTGLPSEDN